MIRLNNNQAIIRENKKGSHYKKVILKNDFGFEGGMEVTVKILKDRMIIERVTVDTITHIQTLYKGKNGLPPNINVSLHFENGVYNIDTEESSIDRIVIYKEDRICTDQLD